ncbi:MFS transporter [Sinimarinibacterium thermocellulolyticum]|uniref:Multidrug efflux pump Tap n=1 Tax=Sinimarinibacterium thermocellulolyticum TaxID=3170016 RepID=A0ABV2A758_9GAMM
MPRRDPYAALRYPEFVALLVGSFLLTAALMIQQIALAYELYRVTRDPLALGLIGLAEAVPFIALALFGGHVADRFDKRRIMQLALLVMLVASAVLALIAWTPMRERLSQTAWLWLVYAMIGVLGFARGFYSPAMAALRPFLVPRAIYGNSATWSGTFWQAAAILGPVAGGLAYAAFGLAGSLIAVMALIVSVQLLLLRIEPRPVSPDPVGVQTVWASLREGLGYVRRTPIILYAITLDMLTVLFGGVVAILPIFAEDILEVGPEGLGILRAAPAVGALLTIITCTYWPPLEKAWRNLLLAVLGFGLATLVFAVSELWWLSIAALFLTGAFDSISVVIRNTILQTTPPDHLRGRVQAVNSIFISASNEIGAFESGLAARLMGTVPSVIFGGVVTIGIVAEIWRRTRTLLLVNLADGR